jgi:glutamate transport system permease protein
MTTTIPRRKTRAANVLYDEPGPKARAQIWLWSGVLAVLALVGVYFFVYRPLDVHGQFEWELWAPLLDPSTEEFPQVWNRLGHGWLNTLTAAAGAIAASLVFGTGLAVLRMWLAQAAGSPSRGAAYFADAILTWITRLFVEVFRGLPVVITIFFVARGLPELGLDLSARAFLIIGLTLYNMVVIGEIIRAGMANIPRGQGEAAAAIGLSGLQTVWLILLPQSFRIMLPALISQVVVVLKDTSLGFIIGYEEVLRIAGQLIQVLSNPIQVYVVIAVIYILINYTISRIAVLAQRRIARGGRTGDAKPPADPVPGASALSGIDSSTL